MIEYRVIDLQTKTIDPEPKVVQAATAERAAELVLGLKLVRSGSKNDLRARVYFQHPGQTQSMIRLYIAAADRPSPVVLTNPKSTWK